MKANHLPLPLSEAHMLIRRNRKGDKWVLNIASSYARQAKKNHYSRGNMTFVPVYQNS